MAEVQLIQNSNPTRQPKNQFVNPVKTLFTQYYTMKDEIENLIEMSDMTDLQTLYQLQNTLELIDEIEKGVRLLKKQIEADCNKQLEVYAPLGFYSDDAFEIEQTLSNRTINKAKLKTYYPVQYKKLLNEEKAKLDESFKPTVSKVEKALSEREMYDVVDQNITGYKIYNKV